MARGNPALLAFCLAVVAGLSLPRGTYGQQRAITSQKVGVTQKPTAPPGFYGLPAHLRGLTDLLLLEDIPSDAASGAQADDPEAPSSPPRKRFTAPQKTEIYLSWLAAERKDPSPITTGLGGGPIGTDYIQAQIVKGLSADGDRLALEWVLSSQGLKDSGLRDAVRLALGGMGDLSQTPALERILLKNPNPYFRAIAVDDLGLLDSAASLPVLERALEDDYSEAFASHSHGGKMVTVEFHVIMNSGLIRVRCMR